MNSTRRPMKRTPLGRPSGRAFALAAACGIAMACASTPPPELVAARNTLDAAKQSDRVQQRASVELYEAEQTLSQAERTWSDERDVDETVHLSYLTTRKVERANLAAQARGAAEEAKSLSEQRDKIRLEVRTAEAEASLSAAERARRDADRRAAEAEQARLQAEEARSEAESSRLAAEAARAEALAAAAREEQLRKEIEELEAKKTDRGIVLTLGDVLFDVDQASLKPGAMQNLYRLVTFLKERPERSAVVEGHTDSTGADAYNLELSQRRAESVVAFLVDNGIESQRLRARGFGKALPVATNATSEGRQRNRRVEVIILEPGEDPDEALRTLPSP